MFYIDSHQHFWKFNAERDNWITDDMNCIRRDFLPADLLPEMRDANIQGCVAVQANQSEEETHFLLSLAKEYSFIKGIIGWADLCADRIEETLAGYATKQAIKGFRHILQSETDRAFMLTNKFRNGIKMLTAFHFTYDILITPDQMQYIPGFLQQHPDQKFVIDHLAKPDIKHNGIEEWKQKIDRIAQYENVSCKISGMATEADWHRWQLQDFTPYLDVVWEAFGAGRVMFGSDWPVCLLATTYKQWVTAMEEYTAQLTQTEKECFWGKNAASFYKLTIE